MTADPSLPTARVITVSDRAAAGIYSDRSGPIVAEGLQELGFRVAPVTIVPDGELVSVALSECVAAGVDVVITTGGTGLSPRDLTPEQTRVVIEREIPGIAEQIRLVGASSVATSALSRGISGTAGRTLIVNLPGSVGGVRDGMAVLSPILRHAVDQIGGGDHG